MTSLYKMSPRRASATIFFQVSPLKEKKNSVDVVELFVCNKKRRLETFWREKCASLGIELKRAQNYWALSLAELSQGL